MVCDTVKEVRINLCSSPAAFLAGRGRDTMKLQNIDDEDEAARCPTGLKKSSAKPRQVSCNAYTRDAALQDARILLGQARARAARNRGTNARKLQVQTQSIHLILHHVARDHFAVNFGSRSIVRRDAGRSSAAWIPGRNDIFIGL